MNADFIRQIDGVIAELRKAPGRVRRGMNKGLYAGAVRIFNRSQEMVPVGGPPTSPRDPHPGELKDSGHIFLEEPPDDVATITISYGTDGVSKAYARRQHEDLTYRHKPGQQSKFLERAVLEEAPKIRQPVVAAMREELSGGR